MKNLLSKTLMSGVLASSLILVNCQKAPNRATKAQTNNAKPTAKIGDCSADAATSYENVKTIEGTIVAKLEELKNIASDKLTPEQKNALKGLAAEMLNKAKVFTDEMQKLKLDGCKIYEGEGDKKKVKKEVHILEVLGMRSQAGKNIKAKTCDDNAITEADAKDNKELVAVNQSYKVSEALAKAMSDDANSADKGKLMIVASELRTDADVIIKDETVTSCGLNISSRSEIKTDAIMKIISVDGITTDEKTKRSKITVTVSVKSGDNSGDTAIGLVCYLAKGKEREAAKEVRNALGAKLVTLVEADLPASCKPVAVPVDPAPVVPASSDPTVPVSTDPTTPVSGDSTQS